MDWVKIICWLNGHDIQLVDARVGNRKYGVICNRCNEVWP